MGNETQWTPGPWHEGAGNGSGSIFGPEGTRRDFSGLSPIAMINGALNEDAANARLIAAAPEMAALLERNQNVIMDALTGGHGITPAIADDMRAVLAEARALLAKIKKGNDHE